MNKETIALVFMTDSNDSFFIENPPEGPPNKWIGKFAEKDQVEHVQVVERGDHLFQWSNPNVSPETEF